MASEDPSSSGKGSRSIKFAAGLCSGLTKLAIGHPFDTVKTRLQCAPGGTYTGAGDCFLKTVRREGPLALHKGASPSLLGWIVTDSVLLGTLHSLRLVFFDLGLTEADARGKETRRLTVLGHGLAGLGAGLANSFCAAPVENIKGKLQLQYVHQAAAAQAAMINSASSSTKAVLADSFNSPFDVIRQVYRTQGLTGFYRGFPATLVFRAGHGPMFAIYEIILRSFSRLEATPYVLSLPSQNFLAGGLAASAFWLVSLPADNTKNRMMTDRLSTPRYSSVLAAVRAIYVEGGVLGFWRGFAPVALRAFPMNASALMVYESVMRMAGTDKTRGRA